MSKACLALLEVLVVFGYQHVAMFPAREVQEELAGPDLQGLPKPSLGPDLPLCIEMYKFSLMWSGARSEVAGQPVAFVPSHRDLADACAVPGLAARQLCR